MEKNDMNSVASGAPVPTKCLHIEPSIARQRAAVCRQMPDRPIRHESGYNH